MAGADIIDQLASVAMDSRLAELRTHRSETRDYAQGSYLALLEPADPGGASQIERESIGLRVATLEASPDVAAHHRARLAALGMSADEIAQIEQIEQREYIAETPNRQRDIIRPRQRREFAVDLPDRLRAIMQHVDLLTISPRTGSPESLESLRRAGLSARDIVTISQLIAYLSYQIRMVALLHAMGDEH